ALDRSGLTDQARRVRIAKVWREAVGAKLAERTAPESFNRGVLLVRAASAAWQNELTYLREELIGRINATLGTELVKDIKVLSGRFQRPKVPESRRKRPLTDREREAVDDAAQAIQDPELRQALERALAAVARSQDPS
ncbi:MAG: DUF721 domain-containing protein, partial [Myxococcota bacterium]